MQFSENQFIIKDFSVINFMSQDLNVILNFICGWGSGVVEVFVMQPFEMVKVRLINQSHHEKHYNGIIDCIQKIYLREGITSFYKGTLSPLLTMGLQVAVQFSANQTFKNLIKKYVPSEKIHKNQPMEMKYVLLAGFLSGIPSSIIQTPTDHTRIVMQMQKDHVKKYTGSVDAGIKIFRKYGIQGLYLGFFPTILRETFSLASYFGTYESIWRYFNSKSGQSQDFSRKKALVSFFGGGVAGMMAWLTIYPIDYVKTLIQSENLDARKYTSATRCAIEKYRQEGIRTFCRGLGITMLRSYPVNACGFLSFEYMMKLTGQRNSAHGF